MAPRLGLEPPLEVVSARVRLTVFSVPGGPPPENPISPETYIFTMVFDGFSADRGPKLGPPGSPLI